MVCCGESPRRTLPLINVHSSCVRNCHGNCCTIFLKQVNSTVLGSYPPILVILKNTIFCGFPFSDGTSTSSPLRRNWAAPPPTLAPTTPHGRRARQTGGRRPRGRAPPLKPTLKPRRLILLTDLCFRHFRSPRAPSIIVTNGGPPRPAPPHM